MIDALTKQRVEILTKAFANQKKFGDANPTIGYNFLYGVVFEWEDAGETKSMHHFRRRADIAPNVAKDVRIRWMYLSTCFTVASGI